MKAGTMLYGNEKSFESYLYYCTYTGLAFPWCKHFPLRVWA